MLVYRCRNCGAVLAFVDAEKRVICRDSPLRKRKCLPTTWFIGYTEVKSLTNFGIPSPSDVIAIIGYKCPKCGKKLNTDIDPFKDIVISVK